MEYIIAVILLMVLFSLPDVLRRRRRYPSRKRRTSPMEKPTPRSVPPQTEMKRQEQVKKRPIPSPQPEVPRNRPVSQQPSPASLRLQQAAMTRTTQQVPVNVQPVTARVQPAAWSELSGEARDIYAGLVWSELLQKPVALRRK